VTESEQDPWARPRGRHTASDGRWAPDLPARQPRDPSGRPGGV